MKKMFSALLWLVAFTSLCVGQLRAAVLYSQIDSSAPTTALGSNDLGSASPTTQKVADDFVVNASGPYTIRSLQFIGGYPLQVAPIPTDDFHIVFFSSAPVGVPEFPIAGGDFHGVVVQRTATGGPLLNGIYTPFEYTVDLGAGITLSPAKIYCMVLMDNCGPNSFWEWARTSTGVADQQVAETLGNISGHLWDTLHTGGMSFALSDNNVPEPSFFSLLTVLGVSSFIRRRGGQSLLAYRKWQR